MQDLSEILPISILNAQRIFYGRGAILNNYQWLTLDYFPPFILATIYIGDSKSRLRKEYLEDQKGIVSKIILNKYKEVKEIKFHIIQKSNEQNSKEESIIVNESGLSFEIRLNKNNNTGLFMDATNLRSWLREHSQNKKVLNLFSYTCSLGVSALKGNALEVFNVDMSTSSLNWGKKNYQLNKIEIDNRYFIKANIVKNLKRLAKGSPFDLIIADPPTRQKKNFSYQNDYKKLIAQVSKWLSPEGQVIFTCHDPFISTEEFLSWIKDSAPELKLKSFIPLPTHIKFKNKDSAPRFLHFSL